MCLLKSGKIAFGGYSYYSRTESHGLIGIASVSGDEISIECTGLINRTYAGSTGVTVGVAKIIEHPDGRLVVAGHMTVYGLSCAGTTGLYFTYSLLSIVSYSTASITFNKTWMWGTPPTSLSNSYYYISCTIRSIEWIDNKKLLLVLGSRYNNGLERSDLYFAAIDNNSDFAFSYSSHTSSATNGFYISDCKVIGENSVLMVGMYGGVLGRYSSGCYVGKAVFSDENTSIIEAKITTESTDKLGLSTFAVISDSDFIVGGDGYINKDMVNFYSEIALRDDKFVLGNTRALKFATGSGRLINIIRCGEKIVMGGHFGNDSRSFLLTLSSLAYEGDLTEPARSYISKIQPMEISTPTSLTLPVAAINRTGYSGGETVDMSYVPVLVQPTDITINSYDI